jgi:hypothetical protein
VVAGLPEIEGAAKAAIEAAESSAANVRARRNLYRGRAAAAIFEQDM